MFIKRILLRIPNQLRLHVHQTISASFYRRHSTVASRIMLKHLNQSEAIRIDEELFNDHKFDVVQLMELAGLSCAHAIAKSLPPLPHQQRNRVLVLCGPGNNGGDGLVCARHITLLGYRPTVVCARPPDRELFQRLVHQCRSMEVPVEFQMPSASEIEADYALIVDALFGFSFRPPVRAEYVAMMELLRTTKLPIASIDIPSGWHVENGPDPTAGDFQPTLLISLTAPKLCAKHFTGAHHYLGGRFVPPSLAAKYALNLPDYPGTDSCVRLPETQ